MLSGPELSKALSDQLDELGYSEKRVQERIGMSDKKSVADTLSTRDISSNKTLDKFLVGSKTEGISLEGESDSDWMQVNTAVICTDKLKNIKYERDGHIIFRIDRKHTPAGYMYLRYLSTDENNHPYFDHLKPALEENEKGIFLSSKKYMDINEDVYHMSPGWLGRNTIFLEKKGPSCPKVVQNFAAIEWILDHFDICRDVDLVRGFQCFCPSVLNNWLHRRRFSSWPTQETKDEIARLPYHVVPVGLAGSPNKHLQWRFSFTLAEICLVRSFNETQRKMLIILRYIARHILKDIAPEITSYIMKNVAFWMAEKTPADNFCLDELFDRVMDGIEFLLECVKKRKLKNYMVPKRNLFQGKLEYHQRKCLIKRLEELKSYGQIALSIIFQCQNMKKDYPDIGRLLRNVSIHNFFDKISTLKNFPFSPVRLAQVFIFCFYCKSGLAYFCYSSFLHSIKCIGMFGARVVTDPMNIDLAEKLKEAEVIWFWRRVIARNKAGTKRLIGLKPCSYLWQKLFQTFSAP